MTTPMYEPITSKLYTQTANCQGDFRKLTSLFLTHANNVLFIYQGKEESPYKEFISNTNELFQTIEDLTPRLIHNLDFVEKIQVIHDFYANEHTLSTAGSIINFVRETLYREIENIPSDIEDNEDVDFRECFGRFNPERGLDSLNAFLEPSNEVFSSLSRDNSINYDKFSSVANFYLSLRDLINLKDKFLLVEKEFETSWPKPKEPIEQIPTDKTVEQPQDSPEIKTKPTSMEIKEIKVQKGQLVAEQTKHQEAFDPQPAQITKNQETIETQNTQIKQNQESIESQNTQIKQNQESIESQNTQIRQNQETIESQNTQIKQNQESIESQKTQIRQIQEAIEAQRSQFTKNQETIETQNTQIRHNQESIEAQKTQFVQDPKPSTNNTQYIHSLLLGDADELACNPHFQQQLQTEFVAFLETRHSLQPNEQQKLFNIFCSWTRALSQIIPVQSEARQAQRKLQLGQERLNPNKHMNYMRDIENPLLNQYDSESQEKNSKGQMQEISENQEEKNYSCCHLL